MAKLLTTGTIMAVAEETVFGEGKATPFDQSDVLNVNASSSFAGTTEALERDILNASFINCPSVSGNEASSGNFDIELGVVPTVGLEKGMLKGHLLFKQALGTYVEAGADISVAGVISEAPDPVTTPADADLYRLSRIGEPTTSLSVREYIGGSGDSVMTYNGVVLDSMALSFASGQILVSAFNGAGIDYVPSTGETPLTSIGCGSQPFVVKNCVFKADGVDIEAMDVNMSISNTITDRMGITGTGVTEKIATTKGIELTYTLDMEDISLFTKLKANFIGSIYIKAISGTDTVEFYLPQVNIKDAQKSDDSGITTVAVTSSAYNDAEGNAIYIASKKGA